MPAKQRVGLVGLLIGLALLLPATALGASAPGVTVIGQENQVLATFKTAKCKKGKPRKTGASFYAEAVSTDGQYELAVDIFFVFTGFHKYDLTLDPTPASVLRFSTKGDFASGGYSNEFVPPYSVPGFGQINFTPNGKRMGVGFGPAMWNRDASDAVVLAGGLECRFPKKAKH
jgi:hypothetical protein